MPEHCKPLQNTNFRRFAEFGESFFPRTFQDFSTMAEVNAYSAGQYLGIIQTYSAHNLTPGQVVTARNLICGDTCKVKILQPAEYTDQFYTNRFPSPQWCTTVEPLTIWQRPTEPEPLDVAKAKKRCAQQCIESPPVSSVRQRRKPAPPAIRPSVLADIPSPFKKD